MGKVLALDLIVFQLSPIEKISLFLVSFCLVLLFLRIFYKFIFSSPSSSDSLPYFLSPFLTRLIFLPLNSKSGSHDPSA